MSVAPTESKSRPRVLLAAGGTGGHIYPAVALASALRELAPDVDVQFICGQRPSEWQLYRRLGIEPWTLPLGHKRSGLRERIRFAGQFTAALGEARRLIRANPVSVAVGFGSYVSVAPLIAAKLSGSRIILHEQNVAAGAANRVLAPLASAIATAVERPIGLMGRRRQRLVGNPVRAELLKRADRAEARRFFKLGQDGLVCLCLGGSQGALGLNRVLLDFLHRTAESDGPAAHWQLLWSTGPAHFDQVTRELGLIGRELSGHGINPFIEEMGRAYAAADLVVARAGALTIAELTALGLPAILVPLPNAGGGHQFDNARRMVEAGAAALVDQRDPKAAEKLGEVLGRLAESPGELAKMADAAGALGRPDAARELARVVLEFV
ncbi:MAG: UDP-N-acetylglucosamine--N-acetylmuramyl-(pentapeptide) pyrophosphoryl-undecaprenol N-acetylglucosamine transferase [Candidatus Sumerlaeia bacterium]